MITQKQIDKVVERAYYASCRGVQISIMDIGKVFAHGRTLVLRGKTDSELQTEIRAFVDTLTVRP